MVTDATRSFAERYGPWAIVAGASDGTGRAFARRIAAQGVPSVLIARRQGPLDAVAKEIREESGIECVTASIDLSAPDAFGRIVTAVGDREVGLLVYNAGADPNGSRFLDRDVDAWLELVRRNVLTQLQCCHHFAGPMRARRRGGLLLVSSGAGYGGASFMAVYSATKGFLHNLADGLWAELRPHHVDVLTIALITTDTPSFHRLLTEKGMQPPPYLAPPDEVAEVGLSRLPHGPIHNWGQKDDEAGYALLSPKDRRARIESIDAMSRSIFGD